MLITLQHMYKKKIKVTLKASANSYTKDMPQKRKAITMASGKLGTITFVKFFIIFTKIIYFRTRKK